MSGVLSCDRSCFADGVSSGDGIVARPGGGGRGRGSGRRDCLDPRGRVRARGMSASERRDGLLLVEVAERAVAAAAWRSCRS